MIALRPQRLGSSEPRNLKERGSEMGAEAAKAPMFTGSTTRPAHGSQSRVPRCLLGTEGHRYADLGPVGAAVCGFLVRRCSCKMGAAVRALGSAVALWLLGEIPSQEAIDRAIRAALEPDELADLAEAA